MVNMDRLQYFLLALANKYAKILDERHILVKEEKDGSYRRVIVDEEHPAVLKYSKNTEMLRISVRYGHYNRFGVPQFTFA